MKPLVHSILTDIDTYFNDNMKWIISVIIIIFALFLIVKDLCKYSKKHHHFAMGFKRLKCIFYKNFWQEYIGQILLLLSGICVLILVFHYEKGELSILLTGGGFLFAMYALNDRTIYNLLETVTDVQVLRTMDEVIKKATELISAAHATSECCISILAYNPAIGLTGGSREKKIGNRLYREFCNEWHNIFDEANVTCEIKIVCYCLDNMLEMYKNIIVDGDKIYADNPEQHRLQQETEVFMEPLFIASDQRNQKDNRIIISGTVVTELCRIQPLHFIIIGPKGVREAVAWHVGLGPIAQSRGYWTKNQDLIESLLTTLDRYETDGVCKKYEEFTTESWFGTLPRLSYVTSPQVAGKSVP